MVPDTPPPTAPRVFISAKSADYDQAAKVYDFLTAAGVPAFFSRESLPELGRSDYAREIDIALDGAVHMVVVTSSADNVQSRWVEAEWRFFINEKRSGSGRKRGNLITVLVGGLKPADLPPSLRYYEAIPFEPAGLDKLLRYVQETPGEGPPHETAARAGRPAFREVATFGGPPPVKLIAATSDGRTIATGGLDGAVRPYDVVTRVRSGFIASARYRKARHEGLVTALAFSPDGCLVGSGHLDGSVHVWRIGSEDELAEGMRHDWAINGLIFLDGGTLATTSKDGVLKLWDVKALGQGPPQARPRRKPSPIAAMTAVRARHWYLVALLNRLGVWIGS